MTGATLVPVASRELLGALIVEKSRFGSKDGREVADRKGRKFVNRVSCSTSPASITRLSPSGVVNFRPCIDIHKGKVKQIVGSTLRDPPKEGEASNLHESAAALVTNFESEKPARFFAEMYKEDELQGGHVIMLDRSAASQDAAFKALDAYPGGLQIGGGINPDTAKWYLDAGASHVIVTSFAFSQGKIDSGRLQELVYKVGRKRLVLDLSCRRKDGKFFIVTDRWQQFSDVMVNPETLEDLADSADEFLVHGVDVEGTRLGIDEELVHILANSPIPVTYAGGAKSLEDLDRIKHFGNGVVDVTVGSALDIFGGSLPYRDVVTWSKGSAKASEVGMKQPFKSSAHK